MTTAEDQRGALSRVALRCTRAVLIALVAAVAVLVHHETATPMPHIPPSLAVQAADMAGMSHGPGPSTQVRPAAHAPHAAPPGTTAPVAVGGDGLSSCTSMQHCTAAGVDKVKLVPPAELAVGHTPAAPARAGAGRHAPGTAGRAPPDLTFLSRLLL
ncbi:MAG: hypothetical protein JF597_50470 [Streptomyces sp.]|jgi:hypothetical protein|uniref:hypothetical protein n=1 Tax=Streptomyces sp. TaxID=1931 RepID=UPI0025EF7D1D|nr:hypothetical protein [Streptomyces sp.]MBW8801481.1 hypothetical protein [Streptomyces sp.]